MAEWRTESVEDCLVPLSLQTAGKVQARDYKPAGKYPVVDQGQSPIAGWTDDEAAAISCDLPVVVFGDHTRALKYVDFPFVRGADGTQVLKPKPEIDPRFFFYALRAIDLPSRGYNRHFKALKEAEIALPSPQEQIHIAGLLKLVEGALVMQDEELSTAAEAKKATMRTLFTRGLRGEPQKETEIGLVPGSWNVTTLGEISTLERGRFLHRPRNEPRFYGGEMPFVQTGDVVRSNGRIREFTQTLNEEGIAISRVFPKGTILITIAANIGYTGILQFDSACPDSLVAITPKSRVTSEFLEYWLQTQQPDMDRLAPKGTQKNINIQFLTPWPVALPPPEEQDEIVSILDAIDRKIDLHRRKRAVLDELFKALLHKLMTGEICVADLDLSALTPNPSAELAA